MQLITSSTKLSKIFRNLLSSCTKVHLAVAWASVGFSEYEALVEAEQKIGRVVIGTHFYQTHPEFIEKFSSDTRVRFVMDHSGVFHPKLYLFEREGGAWTCIVGSANFTAGGFLRNNEACLLVTEAADPHGMTLAEVHASLERYWKDAVPGTNIDLDRYREMHKRLARSLAHAAGKFGKGQPGRAIEDVEVLNMSWDEFLQKVRDDRHQVLEKRLDVLKSARSLFQRYNSFVKIPPEYQQKIAGFREDDDVPWRSFGNMQGAGVFKSIVNRSPSSLSDALDQIPLDGRVTREDYLEFVKGFVQAFPVKNGKKTRHGLGTATRLLAMKRPDYFVCLDDANRRKLLSDLGVKLKLHDYDEYWDKVVERLKLATWWNARRPREETASRVWDGRAAMLDAIYFVPKN